MRTGVYLCKFIPIMLYCMEPMDGKFQKWRDAGIIQKLVLTQKVPYISTSLRLDDPMKFGFLKRGKVT